MSHYDMGNDFFRLVLDPEMIYSCALFKGDGDLAAAQRHKLDHHIEAAGAANAARVLDIGCGWGRCSGGWWTMQASPMRWG